MRVKPLTPEDRPWVEQRCTALFGGTEVVSRGELHRPSRLEGRIAWEADRRAGHATFLSRGGECELVTLEALSPGHGVGSALLAAVEESARQSGCYRVWLVTTNDNLPALRFYQRRGYDLAALHRNALAAARQVKPGLPEHGADGIPLRHELEMEKRLRLARVRPVVERRGEVCERILRELPEWFGLEEALRAYVRKTEELPMLAVPGDGGEPLGFLSLEATAPSVLEIHVMAVRPGCHGQGWGRELVWGAQEWAVERGYRMLTVKTLAPTLPYPPYEATRRFYQAVGFEPVEEFPELWGPANPCLFMAKVLR